MCGKFGACRLSSDLHTILLLNKKDVLTSNVGSQNELLKQLLSITASTNELLPELRVVPLAVNQVLYEQEDSIESVYFPLDSVVSEVAILKDGATIETSMVCCDGVVGISTLLNNNISRQWIWVTIAGNAIQVDSQLLGEVIIHHEKSAYVVDELLRITDHTSVLALCL